MNTGLGLATIPAIHEADVSIQNVQARFGTFIALDDVSLEVPAGQTTCLIGPSGSGKSTLLRCINRLEPISAGVIRVGDMVMTDSDINVDKARARIGMVFQHFNLFPHMTALGNVALALRRVRHMSKDKAQELALQHLDAVGLRSFASRRPSQLSGGQQQRVAIARGLAMGPEVMLFDEVTSALDPELVKGILGIMKDLALDGITMVVVTHELRFAREVAAQVAFLDRGRLLEVGNPVELFDSPKHPRLKEFLSQVL